MRLDRDLPPSQRVTLPTKSEVGRHSDKEHLTLHPLHLTSHFRLMLDNMSAVMLRRSRIILKVRPTPDRTIRMRLFNAAPPSSRTKIFCSSPFQIII